MGLLAEIVGIFKEESTKAGKATPERVIALALFKQKKAEREKPDIQGGQNKDWRK